MSNIDRQVTERLLLAMSDIVGDGKPVATKREFAQRMKIGPQLITQWQNGTSNVTARHCSNLVREFGISGDWLLAGRGPRYYKESGNIADIEKRITSIERKLRIKR